MTILKTIFYDTTSPTIICLPSHYCRFNIHKVHTKTNLLDLFSSLNQSKLHQIHLLKVKKKNNNSSNKIGNKSTKHKN